MRILILASITLLFMSCKDLEITRYEYQTSTMMGKTVLAVTPDSVIVTFNGRGEPTYYARGIKDAEWNDVNASMKNVDLSKVSSLESPTNGRESDRSPYAKFNFIGKDSTISSADFDGGKPHDMLQPLMKEFEKIQEKNKK
jgi:hypothetical protein